MKCSRCEKDVCEKKIMGAMLTWPDGTLDGRSCALCKECLKEVKAAARIFFKSLDSTGKKKVKKQ